MKISQTFDKILNKEKYFATTFIIRAQSIRKPYCKKTNKCSNFTIKVINVTFM